MDNFDFGIRTDRLKFETEDSVRRHFKCDMCNKDFPVYIPKESKYRGENGLLILTDMHKCVNGDRYFNLYIDQDYEIRSLVALQLPTFEKRTLAPLPNNIRKIEIDNIPTIDMLKIQIRNHPQNYEIVIGKEFNEEFNLGVKIASDQGIIECVINTELIDIDATDLNWITHLLNYISQTNPSLEDILEALSYRSPSGNSAHFDAWRRSIDICAHCLIDVLSM